MKQFLLICDESAMKRIQYMFEPNNIEFLEVVGIPEEKGGVNFTVLATPFSEDIKP